MKTSYKPHFSKHLYLMFQDIGDRQKQQLKYKNYTILSLLLFLIAVMFVLSIIKINKF